MKFIKQIILGIVITLGIFGGVLYTSCTKDSCKGVNCVNAGSCNGGSCSCKSGIGGSECETIYRMTYQSTFKGNAAYMYTVPDTNNTNHSDTANTLAFTANTSDTANYNTMTLVWQGASGKVTFAVTLANNTLSGSSFTVTPTSSGGISYTGSGTITTSAVSFNLVETQAGATPLTVSMENFIKQ